jgi:hypothetical protein
MFCSLRCRDVNEFRSFLCILFQISSCNIDSRCSTRATRVAMFRV